MKENNTLFVAIGVGCGCLLVLLACGVTGVLVYLGMAARDGAVAEPVFTPPPAGPSPMTPSAPMVGPAAPVGVTDVHRIDATVTAASGLSDVTVGTPCVASVGRADREDGTFWCNAQITCGQRLLYGGPTAGYFECTLYAGTSFGVAGADAGTSGADRDPAMQIDTRSGSIEISDDADGALGAFHVSLRVDRVE